MDTITTQALTTLREMAQPEFVAECERLVETRSWEWRQDDTTYALVNRQTGKAAVIVYPKSERDPLGDFEYDTERF